MLQDQGAFALEFEDQPISGLREKTYEIVRAKEGRVLQGVIISEEIKGLPTHWTGGQTMPCGRDQCQWCDLEIPCDWHAYFFWYDRHTQLIDVVEITKGPLPVIREYEKLHGTARGAVARLTRAQNRKNGRVVLELVPSKTPGEFLPKAPDIQKVLLRIWSGGRYQKRKTAKELVDEIPQKTFASDVPGVVDIVDQVLSRTRGKKKTNGTLP